MQELRDAMEPLSLVIPTLNEAQTIGSVLAEIPAAYRFDLIVADGGSTDGTQAIAHAAGARVLAAGRGYGRACALGAELAHPDSRVIAFMDGDGADRADLIDRLARPVLDGTWQLALASRTRGEREPGAMLWHQLLAGRAFGLATGLLYGVPYSDMCAFRAIGRDALRRLDMREATYGWNIEMQMKAARARMRVLEVPLPYRRRGGGASKVAGSVPGTLRAGARIAATFVRVAKASGR